MYDNVFFKTPEEAVKQAIRNQEATLDYSSSRLERAIEEVKTIESEITAAKELLAKYKAL
jgi:phage shock protein A